MQENKYNVIMGGIVAVMTTVFGSYWHLFALFLLFNLLDWITGSYKARTLKIESSKAGFKGAGKKVMSWGIILVAFVLPLWFIPIGNLIQIDLSFLNLIGWFTLSSLMVNEARSILENLVEAGIEVPDFLIKGLAVTNLLINKGTEIKEEQNV